MPWSPSFHYLRSIVAPLLFRIGVSVECGIASWGWYPFGNGHVSARITPARALRPLTDQVVPWLAFCEGPSEFSTRRVTGHLLMNLWVVRQFMDIDVRVEGVEGAEGRVMIRPPVRSDRVTRRE